MNTITQLPAFPPEIYGRIAMWACTDGGTTARSLSLVSSYVSNACAAYKLQSVALSGLRAIRSFFTIVTHMQPLDRRVRHLFLSDRHLGQSLDPDESEDSLIEVLKKLIPTLLSLIAQHLQTLALILYGSQPDALILATTLLPLPALEHLSVRVPSASNDGQPILPFSYSFPCLPRLTSLTFAAYPRAHFGPSILQRNMFALPALIARACPALSRIELAELDATATGAGESTARALFCLLSWSTPPLDGVPPHNWFADAQQRMLAPHLPSSVRVVRVQPLLKYVGAGLVDNASRQGIKYLKKMIAAGREGRSIKVLASVSGCSYWDWRQSWMDKQYDSKRSKRPKRTSL